jgi:hypothetical protein
LFLVRLARVLGVRVVDLLAAAQLVDGLVHGTLDDAGLVEDDLERGLVVAGREHEQLARDVLVAALLRELVRHVEELAELVADVDLAAAALDARQPVDRFAELRAQQVDVGAGLRQQAAHGAALLVHERDHEVRRLDELVVLSDREGLRIGQRHLELAGQFVESHE